jgi:two-component system phosphate regulon sensor histidine kinase PhoR
MKRHLQISSLSKWLMIASILLIAGFQCYWLTRLYRDELRSFRRETDFMFRDVVYRLQVQRYKNDTTLYKKGAPDNLFVFNVINTERQKWMDSMLLSSSNDLKKDTAKKRIFISVNTERLRGEEIDEAFISNRPGNLNRPMLPPGSPPVVRYLNGSKELSDSLPLARIDSAYRAELNRSNVYVPFRLNAVKVKSGDENRLRFARGEVKTNFTFVGLSNSFAYQAAFDNPFMYIVKRLSSSIIISLLLITFTIASFIILYRNLLTQRRLAVIKSEFISNITHELKTPITTVNVAIEALRKFSAIEDPGKTKEYLDISAGELQRLSLLVDKVLRLSMFEDREVDLHKETFDLRVLVEEVISIMKLQFEKQHAVVTLKTEGENFTIDADHVHITSVLYNLLDNALKYSKGDPVIEVFLKSHAMHVELKLMDNGIGIPAEYKGRVFEKFFRVPTDDVHNTKGYGLGLSYVNHIIRRHHGFITVESEPGKGSTFTANIPYKEADEIWFDDKRRFRKVVFGLNRKREL